MAKKKPDQPKTPVMHARVKVPPSPEVLEALFARNAIINDLNKRLAKVEEQFCRIIVRYREEVEDGLAGDPGGIELLAKRSGKTVAALVADFTADPDEFPPGVSPPLKYGSPPIAIKANDGYRYIHQLRAALEAGQIVEAVQAAITVGHCSTAIDDIIHYEHLAQAGVAQRTGIVSAKKKRIQRGKSTHDLVVAAYWNLSETIRTKSKQDDIVQRIAKSVRCSTRTVEKHLPPESKRRFPKQ